MVPRVGVGPRYQPENGVGKGGILQDPSVPTPGSSRTRWDIESPRLPIDTSTGRFRSRPSGSIPSSVPGKGNRRTDR